jgi:hypothetical protein
MKRFFAVNLALAVLSFSALAQDPATTGSAAKKKTVEEIRKQVDSTDQKKNIAVKYDSATNRSMISTTRVVLGRQQSIQNTDGSTQAFSMTIPSWEVYVYTAFPGNGLDKTLGDFAWRFDIYNPRFPQDSELKITVDGDVLTFKPAKAGRSAVSNINKVDRTAQLDKTQDMLEANTGNVADNMKPVYEIFILKRADIDKILSGSKVKITLSRQLDVGLVKELKSAVEVLLNVTEVH